MVAPAPPGHKRGASGSTLSRSAGLAVWGATAVATAVAACGPAGDAAADRTSGGETPDPARVVEELRPRVRIVGEPDPGYTLAERMARHRVPGVSVAVIDDHRIVWAAGFGTRTAGEEQPVDTTTLFQAGSISKPVFATGAMRLVEEGGLALDGDVGRHLSSWRLPPSRFTEGREVTLRQLLSHTAGLTVHGFPGYDRDAEIPTVAQVLDGAGPANTDRVRSDTFPGARFSYSGGGYTVAQLAATEAAGEPFPVLMRRLVLAPSGMARSTFENPPPDSLLERMASGHEETDTPTRDRFHVYPEMAAAGLWTTAPDLARWALDVAASWRDGGGVLSRASARQMLSPQVETPDGVVAEEAWGLGPVLGGAGDSLRFGHGGRNEGFVASVHLWPELGRGMVVLTNGTSGALPGELWRAFAEVYGLELTTRIDKRLAPPDSVTLAGLAGRYELNVGRSTLPVTVHREGDSLSVAVTNWVSGRLWPEGRDAFFERASGIEWRFVRPEGGPHDAPATELRVLVPGSGEPMVAERVGEGRARP